MDPQFNPSPIMDWFTQNSPVMDAGQLYGFILKLLFLAAYILYAMFAFIVMRQVKLMDQTVQTPLASLLKLVAWAHFLVAVGILIFAFLVL